MKTISEEIKKNLISFSKSTEVSNIPLNTKNTDIQKQNENNSDFEFEEER